MAPSATAFTGRWADLPLEELALACRGDFFETRRVVTEDGYGPPLVERGGAGLDRAQAAREPAPFGKE